VSFSPRGRLVGIGPGIRSSLSLCAVAAAIFALPGSATACGVAGLAFHRTVGERTGTLSWQIPKGARRNSYAVFRDDRKLGETAGRSFAVGVRPGRRYVFAVQAIDANGQADPCVARLKQEVRFHPPSRPPGLAVNGGGAHVRLVWSRAAPGDGRVAGYRIFRDGKPFRRVRGTSFSMRTPAGRAHGFAVAAADLHGNVGPRSNLVRVVGGHRAPGAPPKVRTRRVGDAAVLISWSAAKRRSGRIAGYRIYRNGDLLGQVHGRRRRDRNLMPATTYRYSVAAIDTLGYMSAPMARASINTPKPDATRGRAHAFLLASAGESFLDLQRHYAQIGTLYPTYFDCDSADGSATGEDNPMITSWSRLRRIRVLPRFNCQQPDMLHRILTDPVTRDSTIAALIGLVRRNGYDGINLDFENGVATDRDALTAYVKRLGDELHEIGERLAVDVSPKFEPTTTGRSGLYDYEAIGRAADTVFVMNWGWHWTTSDPGAPDDLQLCRRVADYVATMPNRSRFVLGTQLYGMDWAGGGGPASPAVALEHADMMALISRYGAWPEHDPAADAWVFAYTDGAGTQHEVWYPNAATIARRVRLARDRGLGIGFWRLGREDPEIWADPLIAAGTNWP
jgi:spore germination protein YaaH